MKRLLKFGLAALICFVGGCTPGAKSGHGFSLPEGDVQKGKATFARLECQACHTFAGVDFEPAKSSEEKMIALGGKRAVVVTHGQLVTSIINPSHRFAFGYTDEEVKQGEQSKMRSYNDEMTVTELIDLVAFLQSQYKIEPYRPTQYRPYYY